MEIQNRTPVILLLIELMQWMMQRWSRSASSQRHRTIACGRRMTDEEAAAAAAVAAAVSVAVSAAVSARWHFSRQVATLYRVRAATTAGSALTAESGQLNQFTGH